MFKATSTPTPHSIVLSADTAHSKLFVKPPTCVQEPPEGNTAEELGLTSATPDHTVWLLQLPPLLPAVPLVEASERKAAANTSPADASSAPAATPTLPELSGPEVLRALPSGKVRLCRLHTKLL